MVDDVESTQRIPSADRWEMSGMGTDVPLDEAQLVDSVTLVRAAPKAVVDLRASSRPSTPPRPSWRPGRRSHPAGPCDDAPTLRKEIPRELLRMLRTTHPRREDERGATQRAIDLHDTDECPTADLSDVEDLEWLDD